MVFTEVQPLLRTQDRQEWELRVGQRVTGSECWVKGIRVLCRQHRDGTLLAKGVCSGSGRFFFFLIKNDFGIKGERETGVGVVWLG